MVRKLNILIAYLNAVAELSKMSNNMFFDDLKVIFHPIHGVQFVAAEITGAQVLPYSGGNKAPVA